MLYILLLEQGKFYVGYTNRPNGARFLEHFSGNGAGWTKRYKPIEVIEFREGTEADEDELTLEMMRKYGWYNVRGGRWVIVDMIKPPDEIMPKLPLTIQEMEENYRSKLNCSICQKQGHSDNDCFNKSTKKRVITCYFCGTPGHTALVCPKKIESIKCDNCDKYGHTSAKCYYPTRTCTVVDEDEKSEEEPSYDSSDDSLEEFYESDEGEMILEVPFKKAQSPITSDDPLVTPMQKCQYLTNRCRICKKTNHLDIDCYFRPGSTWSPFNSCSRCGNSNHGDSDCYYQANSRSSSSKDKNTTSSTDHTSSNGYTKTCTICGRHNHTTERCYRNISNKMCNRCKNRGHTIDTCTSKTHANGTTIKKPMPCLTDTIQSKKNI